MKNYVMAGSCVRRTMDNIINGQGDVSIVKLRVTGIPSFTDAWHSAEI